MTASCHCVPVQCDGLVHMTLSCHWSVLLCWSSDVSGIVHTTSLYRITTWKLYIDTVVAAITVPFHKNISWQLYIWTQVLIVPFHRRFIQDMEKLFRAWSTFSLTSLAYIWVHVVVWEKMYTAFFVWKIIKKKNVCKCWCHSLCHSTAFFKEVLRYSGVTSHPQQMTLVLRSFKVMAID